MGSEYNKDKSQKYFLERVIQKQRLIIITVLISTFSKKIGIFWQKPRVHRLSCTILIFYKCIYTFEVHKMYSMQGCGFKSQPQENFFTIHKKNTSLARSISVSFDLTWKSMFLKKLDLIIWKYVD